MIVAPLAVAVPDTVDTISLQVLLPDVIESISFMLYPVPAALIVTAVTVLYTVPTVPALFVIDGVPERRPHLNI